MNIAQELSTTLLSYKEFIDKDNKLNKILLTKLTQQRDKKLLAILLANKSLKEYFFTPINEALVFNEQKLIAILEQNALFENNVTRFKNKIGLSTSSSLLYHQSNILLVWPYKDTVLEGGQSREDKKQNELFYHEEIHHNEINQLFEPKIFTKWLRYTTNGTELLAKLNKRENFILRGNNLIVLHSLRQRFEGKIKLIYIDPPYNTGSDSFLYNDRFSHSTWLTFMKNRLEIAYKLLRYDGAIFIQVDDSEFAYLKVLCDELFGRENHKETIVLKSSTESGVNAINVKRGERLFKVKEYILFYAKSKNFRFNPFFTKAPYNLNYKYELKENGELVDLKKVFAKNFESLSLSKEEKNTLTKSLLEKYCLNNPENIYSLEKNIKKAGKKFKDFASLNIDKNTVCQFTTSDGRIKNVYKGGELVALKERIVNENGKNYFGVLASDLWVDIATTAASEGGIKFSNGKKPEKLLKRIIEMTTNENDIVLDYHLGSGTTAAVAHKLKRQYIGIEQIDYGENDSTQRLQNVIGNTKEWDSTGISKEIKWTGGGSFVYAEIHKLNEYFIDQIKEAHSSVNLWDIYKSMKKKARLDYRFITQELENNKIEFQALTLNEQKQVLLHILDKNQLYTSISSIDDDDFKISDSDKQLNKQFYYE